MARTISVIFGEAVSGLGYQFFDNSGLLGSRITAGISNPTTGVYRVVNADDTGAIGVHWSNTGGDITADEIFDTEDIFATALLDLSSGVETNITVRQALRVILSTLAGEATGGASDTIVFKTPDGTATRVTLTVDSSGNRTASVIA